MTKKVFTSRQKFPSGNEDCASKHEKATIYTCSYITCLSTFTKEIFKRKLILFLCCMHNNKTKKLLIFVEFTAKNMVLSKKQLPLDLNVLVGKKMFFRPHYPVGLHLGQVSPPGLLSTLQILKMENGSL